MLLSKYMRLDCQILSPIPETPELNGMKNFAIQNRVLQRDRVLQRRVLERYYCTTFKKKHHPSASQPTPVSVTLACLSPKNSHGLHTLAPLLTRLGRKLLGFLVSFTLVPLPSCSLSTSPWSDVYLNIVARSGIQ